MIIKIKTQIIIFFLLFLSLGFYGQQDSQFTQYMYNAMSINPAYAGSRDVMNINFLHRSQWQGIDGAPKTQTLIIDRPMGEKVGFGLSVFRDEIGPLLETSVTVDYSYKLIINDESSTYLAFGLKAGMNIFNLDFSRLNIYNPTDNLENIKKTSPVIGTGVYLYSKKWYMGLSIPNLLSTVRLNNSSTSAVSEVVHFYAIAGYVFDINPNLKFKPATLIKIATGAPIAFDASANFLINKKFTLGVSYRVSAAYSFLAGFQISKQLMMGYAYDYDITDIGKYNSGSHEFFFRYEFFRLVKGNINPRFF